MKIAIFGLPVLGTLLLFAVGIIYSSHKIIGVWLTFSAIIIYAFAFCIYWHDSILEKQNSNQKETEVLKESVNKTQIPSKLSDEDIQRIVDGVTNNLMSQLSQEQQNKSATFGINNKNIILPKKQIPYSFTVDWGTAKIINDTAERVDIMLPTIKGDIKDMKDFTFNSNSVSLLKRKGYKYCPYRLGHLEICAEIIAIKNNVSVVLISINILP